MDLIFDLADQTAFPAAELTMETSFVIENLLFAVIKKHAFRY
ncbi:MAG: hypothetical protein ABIQ31_03760 [Ferruginibacter sp.]